MRLSVGQLNPLPVPSVASGQTLAQACQQELTASGGQPLASNPYIMNMAVGDQTATSCPPGYTLTQVNPPNNNQPCGYYRCLNSSGQNVYDAAQASGGCTGINMFPMETYLLVGGGLAVFLILNGIESWLFGLPLLGFGVLTGLLSNMQPQTNLQTGKVSCVPTPIIM